MDRSLSRYPCWPASIDQYCQSGLVTLTFDLLTLKVVSESRVTSATSVPILVFLCLSVLDLGPMYATDRRQTASSLNAPGRGIIISAGEVQSSNQIVTTNKPTHSCRPTKSKALKEKISHSMDCLPQAHLGLPTMTLATKGSWLPWGRVAKPIISSLTPVRPK